MTCGTRPSSISLWKIHVLVTWLEIGHVLAKWLHVFAYVKSFLSVVNWTIVKFIFKYILYYIAWGQIFRIIAAITHYTLMWSSLYLNCIHQMRLQGRSKNMLFNGFVFSRTQDYQMTAWEAINHCSRAVLTPSRRSIRYLACVLIILPTL